MVLYLTCVSFVVSHVIASLLTYALQSDGSGPPRPRRKGLVRYLASASRAAAAATGGLAPPCRNRFGGLPRDLARQSFAVGTFAVVGPEDLDRVSARWGPSL
jgi:hypothetical protein